MAKRHKHMVGYRIFFVIAIPTMYFLCISMMGFFSDSSTSTGNTANWRGRKLLQTSELEQQWNDSYNCTLPAIKDFPSDGLTRQQRQAGFIIVHFVIAIYLFLLLAIVCDDYFVPSIKKICDKLNVTEDVAGATVMAAASSSPELFINVIGTFVTEGDLGVGTIVGSAVFNILAVPACCALFANQVLNLEWWPVSRDTLAYAFTVILLILTLRDGRIEWYEALILVFCYILYISVEIVNMTSWPNSTCEKIWWIITWPINLVLLITIPDCRRNKLKTWYPFTFLMCVMWIASSSYIIGWVITVIGDTFRIPDSIMGLTFLAAGMSVPEAVSSVIVANQGHGAMGISNSIGSNVFDVLLCLGLPWFVKAALLPKIPGEYYVQINSQGLVYSSVSLFSTLIILYGALFLNKFKLNRTVGMVCFIMYVIFLIFASVIELNTFFVVNLPVCTD
ncbi:Sodium/potassium/calcium exchanger 4 [Harpegnathos saltator]|uniref:Sodium/potassium/calcium exchanger 4 n=1 Tax=Harpegnathos saltator TaxID=610380 RepID=E2C4E7_HARSA|nr:Sodium/potassium/calcium exchanger 4 [Harpegnathos saltator]